MATLKRLLGTVSGWKEMAKDVKGWVIAVLIVGVMFSYVHSLESPVRVLGTSTSPSVGYIGHHYKLCRTVEYVRDSALVIDRAFIQNKDNGDIVTLSLPSLRIKRKEGVYDICRLVMIPQEINEGNWTIKTYISYSYGIWHHTKEAPEIPVYIKYDNEGRFE